MADLPKALLGPQSFTSLSSGVACDSYWTSVHPEYWTKRHVWEWLQFCCDQYKLDINCISFCHFNISGLQLCSMTQEEFVEAAGICGEYLYFILQNIRSQGQCQAPKFPVNPNLSKPRESSSMLESETVGKREPVTGK